MSGSGVPLKIIFPLTILIFLLFHSSPAQLFYKSEKINTDSLIKVSEILKGESKIKVLNKIASAFFYSDPSRSVKYAQQAEILMKNLSNQSLLFETNLTLGTAWMSLGEYPDAASYLLDAYGQVKDSDRLDLKFHAGRLLMLTMLYSGNSEAADKILNEFLKGDMSKFKGAFYFEVMISAAYAKWRWLGKYEDALRLQHICLAISDTVRIPAPNMAVCLFQMGFCQFNLGRYDSAIYYYEKADKLRTKYKIPALDQYITEWIETLWKQGKYGEALRKVEEATIITEKKKQYNYCSNNYILWGEILAELNKPHEAIPKFKKALELGKWIRENKSLSPDSVFNMDYWYTPGQNVKTFIEEIGDSVIRNAHFWLYKEYENTGDTKQALFHHVAYETEKSKLTKLERSKTVMELETKFQTKKKELQIINLSQQNQLKETQIRMREYMLFGVFALLLMIIILATVLIRQNRMKSAHQALILKQKLLRSQMNPHFIFNTLASIQNFILQEDPDKASKYLAKFSKLVRNILDNSVEEYVTLDREISTVENYLELQKIRYAGKFDYSLQVDEKINTEEIYLPPMLCQPFIENALEHGIKHKEGTGRIDISLNLDDRGLIFLITDNGVGRERAKEIESSQQNTHRSMAIGITIDRLKILNKRSGNKITFEITDLKDNLGNAHGTNVTFLFPLA